MSHDLTEKERRFCAEYAATANGAESARRAGYSDVGGGARVVAARMLRKPTIRALVDRLIAERAERTELEGDQIIADLQRLARWSLVPVAVLDKHGRPSGVERPLDGALAARCLELLGKSLGLWRDKIEQIVDQEIQVTFERPIDRADVEDDAADAWGAEVLPPRIAVESSEADESDVEADPPRPRCAGGGAVIVL